MRTFKQFLESRAPEFTGWSSDGRITVYIRGKRYIYTTDALYHDQIREMARFKPWKALNLIKQMIKDGNAWQLDPSPKEPPNPPKAEQPPTDSASKYVQGNLF